ncbi:MAG: hypothetical protein HFE63_06490 [Clostridiales bacterium]|nr:hypothetical protein [Clostridiales bacterium]
MELEQQQKELERIAKIEDVTIYAFVNTWMGSKETRSIQKLSIGTEYRIGELHQYDRMALMGDNNYNKTYPIAGGDDLMYSDPILTFYCKNKLRISYSIDKHGSYLFYGDTDCNPKTCEPYYTIREKRYAEDMSIIIEPGKLTTITFPVNGDKGIEALVADSAVSEGMRPFNYCKEQTLCEVNTNVPEEYADRSRKIWISHLFVTVYNARGQKPDATFMVRISNYGKWDLTMEEFAKVIVYAPELTMLGGEYDYYRGTVIEIIR